MRQLYITSCVLALGGCATTSFAPPQVSVHREGTALSACKPSGPPVEIATNVTGAQRLIDSYLESYTCAMNASADGRQAFEIPAFISLVGATTAVAFGAGPDVAIAGGTGNAIFTAGNKYFAPQQRTAILASAVDALACIQAEASGVDAFDKPKPPEVPGALESVAGGTVELADERRYYNMVNSVVNTVHGIATRRLSTRGSFDAAGIAGEIETLTDKINKAEEAKRKAQQTPPGGANFTEAARTASTTKLELDVLQPKLDKCVVRAKA